MIRTSRTTARPTVAAALCAAVLLAVWAPPAEGHGDECMPLDRIQVYAGDSIRVGDTIYTVVAGRDPARGTLDEPVVRVDLLARRADPATGEPREGSFVPGMQADWRLLGPRGTLGTGPLELSLSSRGPSYGAWVPAAGAEGPVELVLTVSSHGETSAVPAQSPDSPVSGPELDSAGSGDSASAGASAGAGCEGSICPNPDEGRCPELPVGIATTFDIHDLPLLNTTTAGDNGAVRMTLVGALDPRAPDDYSNLWGYSDGTTWLAIIGSLNGTSFINVTNPANPVEVGFIPGPNSQWREMKTVGHYAYIVTEGSGAGTGMQIVNLANPLAPVLVNTYSATFTTAHTISADLQRGHLYVNGSSAGLRILDISANPASPVEIGFWSGTGTRYVHDSYIRDGRAYFSEIYSGLQEIFDATNPGSLQLLKSWTTPNAFTHNAWANANHTLLVTTDETNPGGTMAVYDISNLGLPGPPPLLSQVGPLPPSLVHNAYFEDDDGERVAMSHYGLGAKLVDLHRPSRPVELGSYDTQPDSDTGFVGAWGMYNFDSRGYLYVSDIQRGLFILSYTPTGGTLSGVIRNAATSSPIANARVLFLRDGLLSTTAADGVYAGYATAGPSDLSVTAPGYVARTLSGAAMPLGGRVDLDVALTPLPAVGLTGLVRRSDNSAPIAGATVRVVGTALQTVTAADGSYGFGAVAIGGQIVTAEAFGYSPAETRLVLAASGASTLNLALEPGRFVDDAEIDRGWTLGIAGDPATAGKWVRVNPNGTGGGTVQPEDDVSPPPGVTAFITGQAAVGGNIESSDVDGGVTTLLSPALTTADLAAARIGYHRWLSNNAGSGLGGRLTMQVSPNGTSWTTVEDVTANANSWTRRSFNLGSFIALTNTVRVRFRADPTTPYSFNVLEAGVDEFDLVRSCRVRFNPEAGDSDSDALVNACDSCPLDPLDDADVDGRCGDLDNAPFAANPTQVDVDGDGVGDAGDNCTAAANTDQRDLDRDGAGDAYDADMDADGIPDVSDTDRDNDGVANAVDRCPTVPDPSQRDTDNDGQGDACDRDDGEVQGVRLTGNRISWEPEVGADSYNLYRGDLGAAALVPYAACRAGRLETSYGLDLDQPAPGAGWFYLVTRLAGAVEGPLGYRSDGTPRTISVRCP